MRLHIRHGTGRAGAIRAGVLLALACVAVPGLAWPQQTLFHPPVAPAAPLNTPVPNPPLAPGYAPTPEVKPDPREDASRVLRRMSSSMSPRSRRIAAEVLPSEAADDASALFAPLADADATVREAALASLLKTESEELCRSVLDLYSQRPPSPVSAWVTPVLPRLRERIEKPMLQMLSAPAAPVERRALAARLLGHMGSTAAIGMLRDLAWSQDRVMAPAAGEAFVMLGGHGAVKDLIAMTAHPYPSVRIGALRALTRAGGPEALQALHQRAEPRVERDPAVRLEAVTLIGAIGDETSLPVLIGFVGNMGEQHVIKQASMNALRRITGAPIRNVAYEWIEWYRQFLREHPELDTRPQSPAAVMAGVPENGAIEAPPHRPSPQGVVLPAVPPGFAPGAYIQDEPPGERRRR